MRPLFFIGNVRSGTSQMVRLLNKHPNVYASHEADTCWLLYQIDLHGCIKAGSFGNQKATNHTIKYFSKYIRAGQGVRNNYERVQRKLMRKGSPWLPKMQKKDLHIIGDKTPQNFVVYDEFRDWVRAHFHDAIYLHMVRHPRDFVASVRNRIKEHPYYGKADEEILSWWVYAEEKVKQLKRCMPIITVRYVDIGENTQQAMRAVFDRLCLRGNVKYENSFAKRHRGYKVDLTPEAAKLVQEYRL